MPFGASAYQVMIASPGDVAGERQVIRDTIHEWNAVNARDRAMVLLPVGWETHAAPEMGDRPQAIINRRLLSDCDLLVAVFWTRLGTPTGASTSGTVEEIEEHLAAGKSAMIYFSNAPVRPDSVDREQYDALVAFKKSCFDRGLCDTYDSLDEFRDKLGRQLASRVITAFVAAGTPVPAAVATRTTGARYALSPKAQELLRAVGGDAHGQLMRLRAMGDTIFQTNGDLLNKQGDARETASWESALSELAGEGLLSDLGHKGEIFELTNEGYLAADSLRATS